MTALDTYSQAARVAAEAAHDYNKLAQGSHTMPMAIDAYVFAHVHEYLAPRATAELTTEISTLLSAIAGCAHAS